MMENQSSLRSPVGRRLYTYVVIRVDRGVGEDVSERKVERKEKRR